MDWDALIRDNLKPMVPYAPGLRASEVRERAGVDVIHKLSSNENPYPPVPAALEAMKAVLPRLNLYPDGAVRALKGALAEHLGVSTDRIAVGNGSNELIRVIAEAVLRPGDEVVFAWPSFVVYPMVTQLMGATAVRVPLTEDFVHDLDAMAAAVTEHTRLLFLCNPNNPTGTIYGRESFVEFLTKVPAHVLVVVDEAYFEYVTDSDYPDALTYLDRGSDNIVVLRTFSKIYSLAGTRCGYGVMPRPLAEAVDKVREPFNVNTVAQVGAYYALREQEEVARRRAENAAERERLEQALTRLGLDPVPSQTNFIWVPTPMAASLFEELLARGVIVRSFGTDALRVGVGAPHHNDATIAAFEQIIGEGGA